MLIRALIPTGLLLFIASLSAPAETRVVTGIQPPGSLAPGFRFSRVPPPLENDAAQQCKLSVVDGRPDPNGAAVSVLTDGKLPAGEDEPRSNFFFAAGTDGGRLLMDLGREVRMSRFGTYSWHTDTRAPQVYALYGRAGSLDEDAAKLTRPLDPAQAGWTLIGKVDTRQPGDSAGGRHGVCITNDSGSLGTFRYLLLDIRTTDSQGPFGNTFFSEIDVVDADSSASLKEISGGRNTFEVYKIDDGLYEFGLDVSETPDLADWAREKVIPMARTWYPKLVEMLPSEGYQAPRKLRIHFDPAMRGVAATSGTLVRCAPEWFRANLKGEALGAVFHELVHVVQQYGRRRNVSPVPGWLTEGIADYVRWFRFEPESKGAEITARNLPRARYDGSYRITANFLNWVSLKHAQDLVPRLNAAIRQGQYQKSLWVEITGKELEELGAEWREAMEKAVGAPPTTSE